MDSGMRRATLRRLLDAALAAVEPERLTAEALSEIEHGPAAIIAIGKAAAAMSRGAAKALGQVEGICVAQEPGEVPDGVELLLGDHPIPLERSFEAGRRVLETATKASHRIVALISGGGSALCEVPIEGVSPEFVSEVNQALLAHGAPIGEANLIRVHLSRLKGGGLARAAATPPITYALSDVCGADPRVIASGPTVHVPRDPDRALSAMHTLGIEVSPEVETAIRAARDHPYETVPIRIIGDGHTAATGLVMAAAEIGLDARALDTWVQGDAEEAVGRLLKDEGPGLTVAAGEPVVEVRGDGRGGRATHAALIAAIRLAESDDLFAALATDGKDGNTSAAGAIVDGSTVARAGDDPVEALRRCDAATFLERSGDLIVTGPTGTNVSDLWVLWRGAAR
jgi:hydroxypyruvate reductase